jgi:hypothetical protein
MIVSSLVFIVAMLSLIQYGDSKKIALIFALLTLQHELIFTGMGGFYYFLSAAITDLFIMWSIARWEIASRLANNLMGISFCFILLNIASWIMWECRINYEVAYETLSSALYLCVIISLLDRDTAENGNSEIDWWGNSFWVNSYSRNYGFIRL